MDFDKTWRDWTADLQLPHPRSDFRFDPVFYAANYGDVTISKLSPSVHYNTVGRLKGRSPNLYTLLKAARPNIDVRLKRLINDPDLLQAMQTGAPEAFELAFELVALGAPVDLKVSDFSEKFYKTTYPDIEQAGIHAFRHYMEYGHREGRKTLQVLRRNFAHGDQPYDPDKPTILLGVHQLSRTGAPMVALQMAREAQETHNVVVGGLMGGEIFEAFRRECYRLVVTPSPHEELAYLADDIDLNFDFAVLNSTESMDFLKYLLPNDIPFAMYLHEYTEYTQPYKPLFLSKFSDLLVFSSEPVRESWANVFANTGFDATADTIVLPQHNLRIGQVKPDLIMEARETLSNILGTDVREKRIVYGAGQVHWRKGSDMFALTAQLAKKLLPDTVFIWIGDGENHEDPHFGVYYEKHLVEAEANLPGSNFFTLPAGDAYMPLVRSADAMFLTSRFDPLPNVVFDATKFGNDVVFFRNASGFDDPVYKDAPLLHPVDFGDLRAAVDQIGQIPIAERTAKPTPDVKDTNLFAKISGALQKKITHKTEFVIGDARYDASSLFPAGPEFAEARRKERAKAVALGRRHVWQSPYHVFQQIEKSDNWIHKALDIQPYQPIDTQNGGLPPFSIHMHAFHPDRLHTDLQVFEAFGHAHKVVITTDTHQKRSQISRTCEESGLDAEIKVVPNLGRDILPFLQLLAEDDSADDHVWAHLHQKQAQGSAMSGETWHQFLTTILLGGTEAVSNAITIAGQPDVGVVAPFDPFDTSWAGARRLLDRFSDRFDQPLPDQPLLFPAGNMFWVKAGIARDMLNFFGKDYPWPTEPIATDGTVYHLIERLWPALAAKAGKKAVFIEKQDQPRG